MSPQLPSPAPWCHHLHALCASSPLSHPCPLPLWRSHCHPCGTPSPMLTPTPRCPSPHPCSTPDSQYLCPHPHNTPSPELLQGGGAEWTDSWTRGKSLLLRLLPSSLRFKKKKKQQQTQTYRQAEAAWRDGGRPPMVCLVPDTREVQVAEKVQVHHKAL